MRRITLLFFLLMAFFTSNAQHKNKKFDIESIKRDTSYFCGTTPALTTEKDAYNKAIENLYKNIVNNCKTDAIYIGDVDMNKHLYNIVTSFETQIKEKSNIHANVENYEDDEYSFTIYIKRSEFRNMCNERKASIERWSLRGLEYENEDNYQLEDALQSYYWAAMLCVAHPHGRKLKIDIGEEKVVAYDWLIDRIDGPNGILNSISIILPKEDAIHETDKCYLVNLTIRSSSGFPIDNLQFSYNNGNKYIPSNVNRGKANIELNKNTKPKVNIRIEYEFENESIAKPEINNILKIFDEIPLKNYKKSIDISPYMKHHIDEDEYKLGGFAKTEDVSSSDDMERRLIDRNFQIKDTNYLKIMQDIEQALRNNDHNSVRHHFTDEGFGMFDTLLSYGKMSVVGQQDYNFIKISDQVICRGINMKFDFRNQVFENEVIFRFNHTSKKVESIAFRLSSTTEKDIASKSKWPEESRLILINFLEDYQTAYALKRLDYLESIYSEDALIIVGHVLKKVKIDDRAEFNLSDNDIILLERDKSTYISNLSRTFKAQDYINIKFMDTDFTKAPGVGDKEIYGVRLLQQYHSTTYGDWGYLFLLVDLTRETPLIHVRAWQAEEVPIDRLMDMKDLRF